MITKAGELIDHMIAAAQQYNAAPATEIMVRIGPNGPLYRIDQLRGVTDGRGLGLILQTLPIPSLGG